MKAKYSLIILLIISFIAGCAKDSVSQSEIKKLERATERWEAEKTPDYSFNYLQSCFCPNFGEVEIVVMADTLYAVLNPETGEDATIEQEEGEVKLIDAFPSFFLTIDELFEELKKASLTADEMKGSYDSVIGYPKEVSIDYYKEAVDDEVGYFLSNFQVLTLSNE